MNGIVSIRTLGLHFGPVIIAVESEDVRLLDRLQRYFRGFAERLPDNVHARSILRATESEPDETLEGLTPWQYKGKDAFADRASGRLVRKERTGVSITIQEDSWTSQWSISGPLQRNFSQVVNLAGTIYGLSLLDRGGSMIHASAVSRPDGRTVAVVGQSGMGRSSLAVRLMEEGFDYLSNERIVLTSSTTDESVIAHGLPKLPRVRPGTLLDGERAKEGLWKSGDKYDLEVESVLGRRWLLSGPLACALVLRWSHGGSDLELQRLTPGQALEELREVQKSFGAFDLRLSKRQDTALLDTARNVPVYRVTGNADPARLASDLAAGRLKELA